MPDKAIDLIDEAAAKVRISRLTLPPEIKKKELDIETQKFYDSLRQTGRGVQEKVEK